MQAKKRFWGIFAGGQDRFMAAVLASADRIKQKRIHRWRRASRLRDQAIWLDDLPVGLLVGSGANQKLHYVQPDALGTPRVVIDPSAGRDVAVWKWELTGEAFGNSAPNQDPDGDGTQFVFNMRFAGQLADSASGLSQNYFRDYEPGTGRYVQSDPIGLSDGWTTYAYVDSDPLGYIDPLGLNAISPIILPRPIPVPLPGVLPRPIPGPLDPAMPIPYPADRFPKTGDCKDSEWIQCQQYCFPSRVAGCYVSISWKAKGVRGGNVIRSEQRRVNCRCEDDDEIACR